MIFLRLEAPFEWAQAEGKRVEAFGEVPSLRDYPIEQEEEVVGVVPGEWVTAHRVSLPAKTRKQFNAALPYALEELFAEDVEDLHFVCPKWQADTEVTVYSVSKSKLAEWSSAALENAIPATQIVPDYALLPSHDVAEYSLAVNGDRALIAKADGYGISLDADFVSLWLKETPMASVIAVNDKSVAEQLLAEHSERDIRHWPFGERLSHWLEYAPSLTLNLWSDQFRPRPRKSLFAAYLPATALAILTIGLITANVAWNYFSLHRELSSITQESQSLAKTIAPEIDYIAPGQERMLVERVLAQRSQAPSQASMPRMLVSVAAVFRNQRSTFKELRYSDEQLTISAFLNNLSQADQIQQRLNNLNGLDARLRGTSTQNNALVGTFIISVANNSDGAGG